MKTRREFSRSLLGFGSSVLTLSFEEKLTGAEDLASWPDFSFLIVSDTHIGRSGVAAENQWEKTAEELHQADGDFVLHLGDVVNAGLIDQYPVYTRIRDTIKKPFHEIPGNHDPVAEFEKALGLSADRSFDHGGVRFVLFNNARRDSHDGFIESSQIDWLEGQFTDAAEKGLRMIICAHVPIHFNRPPDRAWFVKPENGQTDFYELLEKHTDRVLAIFHGHFHNGIRGWNDRAPVHEVLMPSALYNQKRNLMEKGAPGYHLPETRPGYILARFSKNQLHLTYRVTGEEASSSKGLHY